MPCPHGRQKSICKDCDGVAICEHKKVISLCKDCSGSAICEHGNNKYYCKDCKGSAICVHSINKRYCKECDGSVYCEHGRQTRYCIECGGSGLCVHKREKEKCRECGGSAFCEHNKQKSRCKECGGSAFCEHGKRVAYCKECGGSAFCNHGKRKSRCKICGGSGICKHNKDKSYCKECGGSACCKSSWCSTLASNKQYDGYCLVCYIHLFPGKPITRNYKTKERAVADFIKQAFPEQTWIQDKRIADGCSAKRPDLLCDLGDQVIIIEIDEDQHTAYDCSCENKRLMELSKDVGHRPMILIRFNPDAYDDIPTCWRINSLGTCSVVSESDWNARLQTLKDQVAYWLTNRTAKTVECVQLYFSNPK